MDMLLLGETIVSPSTDGTGDYLGFWMPAGGNDGVAGVEVFQLSSTSVFEVHLQTKSSDQDDSGAISIGSVTLTATSPPVLKFDVTNARDLVRYRVEVLKASGYVHLQFSQPLWAPN